MLLFNILIKQAFLSSGKFGKTLSEFMQHIICFSACGAFIKNALAPNLNEYILTQHLFCQKGSLLNLLTRNRWTNDPPKIIFLVFLVGHTNRNTEYVSLLSLNLINATISNSKCPSLFLGQFNDLSITHNSMWRGLLLLSQNWWL